MEENQVPSVNEMLEAREKIDEFVDSFLTDFAKQQISRASTLKEIYEAIDLTMRKVNAFSAFLWQMDALESDLQQTKKKLEETLI